jgi:hypothetical protein
VSELIVAKVSWHKQKFYYDIGMTKVCRISLIAIVSFLITSVSMAQILDDVSKAEPEIRQSCKAEISQFCSNRKSDFEDLVNCLGHSKVKDNPCFGAMGKRLAFNVLDTKKVGKYTFPKGSTVYRSRGRLYLANLPVNWNFNGIRCKAGDVLLQDPNPWGSDLEVYLSRCHLDGEQIIAGILFMPGQTMTSFFPTGDVEEGNLAKDQIINGVPHKKGYIKLSSKAGVHYQNNSTVNASPPASQPEQKSPQNGPPSQRQSGAKFGPQTSPDQSKTENLNGVLVPPAPDLKANSTLVGVDSNGNGVRDDAERLLAAKFGRMGNAELLDLARAYQVFISTPLSATADLTKKFTAIQTKSKCLPSAILEAESKAPLWVQASVLTTPERLKAYSDRAGKIILPDISTLKCSK